MFNYFFGSDFRSVPYLEVLNSKVENLQVVTIKPKQSGRGQKVKPNPVENFCVENGIPFRYFKNDAIYSDMTKGLCVSFGLIFSKSFLEANAPLYNIHLSLLPSYVGPSPVENSILNRESLSGITVFEINTNIDEGGIVYQKSLQLNESMYSSDVYEECVNIFIKNYEEIATSEKIIPQKHNLPPSKTSKFTKSDFLLNSKEYEVAKLMIRAFDSIGPAFIKYNDKFYKIHKFTNNPNGFPIELNGGILYPLVITPEGKKKMQVEDYIRGNK